jgi:hypothetical protein
MSVHLHDLKPLGEGVPVYSPLLTRPPEDDLDRLALRPAGGILRGMGIGLAIWILGSVLLWVLV